MDIYSDHKILQYVFTQQEPNLRQKRYLELVKDYDMSLYYHLGKFNVVIDSLSRFSMGSYFHVDEEIWYFVKDIHRLDNLGVCPWISRMIVLLLKIWRGHLLVLR